MNDWQNKSDFEINKAVAGTFDSIFIIGDGSCPHVSNEAVSVGFDNRFGVVDVDVDYCNKPSDAWPIILDNRISVSPQSNGNEWEATQGLDDNLQPSFSEWDKNPLRAAMIVYLEMNGVKQ